MIEEAKKLLKGEIDTADFRNAAEAMLRTSDDPKHRQLSREIHAMSSAEIYALAGRIING